MVHIDRSVNKHLHKEHKYYRILNFSGNALSNVCLNSTVQARNPPAQSFPYLYPLPSPSNIAHRDPIDSGLLLLLFIIIIYYLWFVVPVWTLGGRAAAPLLLWLAVVAARRGWIKVCFLALLLPFAPPDQKSHPPSSISTVSWLSSFSPSPFFLPPFSCF